MVQRDIKVISIIIYSYEQRGRCCFFFIEQTISTSFKVTPKFMPALPGLFILFAIYENKGIRNKVSRRAGSENLDIPAWNQGSIRF